MESTSTRDEWKRIKRADRIVGDVLSADLKRLFKYKVRQKFLAERLKNYLNEHYFSVHCYDREIVAYISTIQAREFDEKLLLMEEDGFNRSEFDASDGNATIRGTWEGLNIRFSYSAPCTIIGYRKVEREEPIISPDCIKAVESLA